MRWLRVASISLAFAAVAIAVGLQIQTYRTQARTAAVIANREAPAVDRGVPAETEPSLELAGPEEVRAAARELQRTADETSLELVRLETRPTDGVVSAWVAGDPIGVVDWLDRWEQIAASYPSTITEAALEPGERTTTRARVTLVFARSGSSPPFTANIGRAELLAATASWPRSTSAEVAARWDRRPVELGGTTTGSGAVAPPAVERLGSIETGGRVRYVFLVGSDVRVASVGEWIGGWRVEREEVMHETPRR